MTDGLRVQLAERLGWKQIGCTVCSYHGDVYPPSGYPPQELEKPERDRERHGLPDLASLVAQAEKRLSEEQQVCYAWELAKAFGPLMAKRDKGFWIEEGISSRALYRLITASPEYRAKALLQVLTN